VLSLPLPLHACAELITPFSAFQLCLYLAYWGKWPLWHMEQVELGLWPTTPITITIHILKSLCRPCSVALQIASVHISVEYENILFCFSDSFLSWWFPLRVHHNIIKGKTFIMRKDTSKFEKREFTFEDNLLHYLFSRLHDLRIHWLRPAMFKWLRSLTHVSGWLIIFALCIDKAVDYL
jgi:hypothetical protein